VFYVTDLRDFGDIEFDPEAPAPALRLARYLHRAVRAATATGATGPRPTALPCRRRPGRAPCPGRLVVEVHDVPSRVAWQCPACGEAGLVDGWQGSVYDLSGAVRPVEGADLRTVVIPDKAYQLLLDQFLIDERGERLVYGARPHSGGGAELSGDEGDFEELVGIVAFESNHAPTKNERRRWDEIYACFEPPRRNWLDQSTDVVLDELSGFGLVAPRAQVAKLVRRQIGDMATGLRISERSARRDVDEEALRELARQAAVELATEQPGADLHDQPRTLAVALQFFGRTIAALAEAAHARVVNADAVGTQGALELVSFFGQILHECPEPSTGPVLVPRAALARAARLVEGTAEMLRQGAAATPGLPADSVATLADAFARDATALRALVDERASPPGLSPDS
jgi:hypothetical protein